MITDLNGLTPEPNNGRKAPNTAKMMQESHPEDAIEQEVFAVNNDPKRSVWGRIYCTFRAGYARAIPQFSRVGKAVRTGYNYAKPRVSRAVKVASLVVRRQTYHTTKAVCAHTKTASVTARREAISLKNKIKRGYFRTYLAVSFYYQVVLLAASLLSCGLKQALVLLYRTDDFRMPAGVVMWQAAAQPS